jgi:hypothetical protein
MSIFLQGYVPGFSREHTVQLTPQQIRDAQMSSEEIKRINALRDDHEQAVVATEGFMATHVARIADPQELQDVANRIRGHTARLAALMEKFPVVP